jgi:hypothetical protein
MQNDFRIEIFECCRCAEWHRENAEAATDPRIAADSMAMERKWLLLAANYEFIDRLSDFILSHDPASFRHGNATRRASRNALNGLRRIGLLRVIYSDAAREPPMVFFI